MIRDLDLEVEIIPHPTVREPDGLAMSSRNARLTPEHRADAPRIHQALVNALTKHTTAADILSEARNHIEASPHARIDYLSLVNGETLKPVSNPTPSSVLACAVFYGDVRLIDHAEARHLP